MRPKRGSFKKYIQKIEGKTPSKKFCSLPPLPILILEEVELFLKTKSKKYLLKAFLWGDSPQGQDHWSNIYHEEKKITQEDLRFVKYILQPHLHIKDELGNLRVSLTEWEIPNEN